MVLVARDGWLASLGVGMIVGVCVLLMIIVSGSSQIDVDEGEQRKHQRLNGAEEQLQPKEHYREEQRNDRDLDGVGNRVGHTKQHLARG